MKKVAAVIAALAVLAAGLPALLGTLAQDRIHSLAETASSSHYLQVSITEYRRGWRNSRASLSVALSEDYRAIFEAPFSQGPGTGDSPQGVQGLLDRELLLAVELVHGPLLTRDRVGLGLADAVVRVDPATEGLDGLLALLGAQGPGEGMARIGIAGVSAFRWAIPPVTFANQDTAGTFASSALVSEGAYHFNRRQLVMRNRMDRLRMSGQDWALEMDDLDISADTASIAAGIWTGTSEMGIGSLVATGPQGAPAATLNNLRIRSLNATNESGDQVHVTIEVNADSVEGTIDEEAQIIRDANLNVALRNLDMAAAIAYQDVIFDLAAVDGPAADPDGFLAALQPIVHDFLEAEPEFEYGPLSFAWNGDSVQAAFLLRIDNEMLPAEPMFSLMDTALWPRLVNVEAELDAGRNVAEWIAMQALAGRGGLPAGIPSEVPADILQAQARGTLITLVAQGMLEETENGYRFRGSYENGVVEVNGTVIPIGAAAQALF